MKRVMRWATKLAFCALLLAHTCMRCERRPVDEFVRDGVGFCFFCVTDFLNSPVAKVCVQSLFGIGTFQTQEGLVALDAWLERGMDGESITRRVPGYKSLDLDFLTRWP